MKNIKKLTETSIGLFALGIISIILGISFSERFSAESIYAIDHPNPEYGFVGFGVLLILISMVLLIFVMDGLNKNSKHLKNKK